MPLKSSFLKRKLMPGRSNSSSGNSGFSLITIIIAMAVVAILAGALGPVAIRQIMQAKEQKTLQEMDVLKNAYLDFFADTGHFPTEAEGLTVLVTDPGDGQWQGPYLAGEPAAALTEFTTDAFGQPYIIDWNPVTDPSGSTEVIIVSAGMNSTITAGNRGGIWTLADSGDDLLVLIEADGLNRQKILLARQEMQTIGNGAQDFFHDQATFPVTMAMLSGTYLDENLDGGAFIDPWFNNYILTVDNAAHPPTLTITSRGPNQTNNAGLADDIILEVDSITPGRKSTYYMLKIIQGSIDTNAATDLTGDWTNDRESFNMGTAFTRDGWGNLYEEAMSTRTILSGGPDADYFTAADNIPTGVIPDDTGATPAWESFGSYTIGDVVTHGGNNWQCRQSHTCAGDPNWAPGIAHSLWLQI